MAASPEALFPVDSILSGGGYEAVGGEYEDALIIHRSDLDPRSYSAAGYILTPNQIDVTFTSK